MFNLQQHLMLADSMCDLRGNFTVEDAIRQVLSFGFKSFT